MNCMIVEDELPAIKVLESHIGQFKDLRISSVHTNAMDAFLEIQTSGIDILFLDIQLPKISGIQFLHSLKVRPAVILTTAYREFALDGYELEITDYLLKPIALERFTKAIGKVYSSLEKPMHFPENLNPVNPTLFSDPFIYVKSEREFVKILLNSIFYIESLNNYIRIVTDNGNFVTHMGLSHMEKKLPRKAFMRIHRSYIVSLQYINSFTQTSIRIGKKHVPVGRHYKQQFLAWVAKDIV